MLRRQRHLRTSTRASCGLTGCARARWAAPAGDGLPARRSGLTLVEMMVAVLILAVGLLGLAGTSALVTRQVGGGADQTLATHVVQSRLEWLRSMPCSSIKDSTATTGRVTERWVRSATVNRVLWVVDTVKYPVGRSQRTQTFTMTVPCSA
ncbi:MAG: prepilin-type N-terminal cleavage/methylation domain-containing protein [Gemmatimonadaceae bacterium]